VSLAGFEIDRGDAPYGVSAKASSIAVILTTAASLIAAPLRASNVAAEASARLVIASICVFSD
jgi:hypothetical protein